MIEARLSCPRCKRVWTISQPTPEVQCVCHLFCDKGSAPEDCNMQIYNYTGELKHPVGLDDSNQMNMTNPLAQAMYCSIHQRYSKKAPIIIEVEWSQWLKQRRIPRKLMNYQTNR
jgi:hypothetical protein